LRRVSSASPLSQEGLDRLLSALDPDRDQAGRTYETLRRKLVSFFEWRDCRPAEELADEPLDRVSRKLLEGVELRLGSPAAYVYGVARNVAREALARAARQPLPVPLGDRVENAPDPASVDPAAEELESALRCLDRCLEALPIEMRRLVLLYHSRQGRGEPTDRLLEALGIPPRTLWVRMHRLRKRLERCVGDCLEGNPPVRHSSTGGGDAP
jgi:DNA-directed RNA polymerase specialized sigma24 family protein